MSTSEKLDAFTVTLSSKQLDALAAVVAIRLANEEKTNLTVQELADSALVIGISYHERYNARKSKVAKEEAETKRKVDEAEAIIAAASDPAKLKAILAKYVASAK